MMRTHEMEKRNARPLFFPPDDRFLILHNPNQYVMLSIRIGLNQLS
ncbi:hypothetical protein Lser_V15G34750 [Lactuca serriola]